MTEGWTNFGGQSRKFHYIPAENDRALCGKWALSPFAGKDARQLANLQPDDGPSKDDCVACRRKLDRRRL